MEDDENNEDVMFTLCNFKYVFTDLVNDSLKSRGLDENYFFGLIITLRFLHRNGPAIIKDINKATQLGYSAINYVIKRGKALNLLKSAPSKTDGRARLISLTKKGNENVLKIHSAHEELNQFFMSSLDDKEQSTLMKSLNKVTTVMKKNLWSRV